MEELYMKESTRSQIRGVLFFLLIERIMTLFNQWLDDEYRVSKQTSRAVAVGAISAALMVI